MATQQVLLLEDVRNLGRKGEVAAAKAGFVRNFLVPQGKAMIADKGTLRMQERLREERAKQAAQDREEAEAVANRISGLIYSTEVKVDPDGHMYGSVTAAEVAKLIHEGTDIEMDKKDIVLAQPIKKIGLHTVSVKLKEGVTCEIQVKVVAEGVVEEDAPAEENSEEGGQQGTAEGGGVVTR